MNDKLNIVVANNCIKQNNQNLSPHEYINYMEFTFEELSELINEDIINGVGNKLTFYELLYLNSKKDINKTKNIKKVIILLICDIDFC